MLERFCLLFDDHNSCSPTLSRRQEGLFGFFMSCVPFHSPEVAFSSNSLFCVFGAFRLKSESFTLWQDEVTEVFQIFLECVSGLQKFADNFFPLFLSSFTVIRAPFVPLKFLRALVVTLSFILYH